MVEKEIVIKASNGICARESSIIASTALKFPKIKITLNKNCENGNAKSIMSVMLLAMECGSKIKIIIENEEEQKSCDAIDTFILEEEQKCCDAIVNAFKFAEKQQR